MTPVLNGRRSERFLRRSLLRLRVHRMSAISARFPHAAEASGAVSERPLLVVGPDPVERRPPRALSDRLVARPGTHAVHRETRPGHAGPPDRGSDQKNRKGEWV